MQPRLQRLSIPGGWLVDYNEFREIDPSPEASDHLKEDLLQAYHAGANRVLDLGWYPEADPAGVFRIYVHVGDFNGEQLHSFASPDRDRIVAELERLLASIAAGEL